MTSFSLRLMFAGVILMSTADCLIHCGSFRFVANAAEGTDVQELFLIGIRSSLIQGLVHQSISEVQAVNDFAEGTRMVGQAVTNGTISVSPVSSPYGLGLGIILSSTTMTSTSNLNVPRDDISINFDWTIYTQSNTFKTIIFNENGFSHYHATSSSASSIQLNSLEAEAEGLFWRLKRRIARSRAYDMIMQTKAQNEYKASEKISQQLNQAIDKKVCDALGGIQQKYMKFFYGPFIQEGLLGGHLLTGSNQNWIVLQGVKSEGGLAVDPDQAMNANGGLSSDLFLKITPKFVEQIAERRLGGTTISDEDMAEASGRKKTSDDSVEEVLGNAKDELLMTFDQNRPVVMKVTDKAINFEYRLSVLETLGKKLGNVVISRPFYINRNPGLGVLPGAPTAVTYYDGKDVEKSVANHVIKRMARYLPTESKDLPIIKIGTGHLGSLAVQNIRSVQGSLAIEASLIRVENQ